MKWLSEYGDRDGGHPKHWRGQEGAEIEPMPSMFREQGARGDTCQDRGAGGAREPAREAKCSACFEETLDAAGRAEAQAGPRGL